jgi:uncharacterized DUF497 family protein
MNEIRFEWNKLKALANKRKHGVSFEEAQAVFYDEEAVEFDDPDHSQDEDRFIILGMSLKLRVLVISHCVRKRDIIRIISARKATRCEANHYWEGKK